MNDFFKLYSCCIPTRGSVNSIICDFQRSKVYRISNELFNLINSCNNIPLDEIYKEHRGVEKVLKSLVKSELGFITNTPERFIPISTDWHIPHLISNSIIEVDNNFIHDYSLLFEQLMSVDCTSVLFKIKSFNSINEVFKFLGLSQEYSIFYIELWFQIGIEKRIIKKIIKNFKNVRKVKIFSNKKSVFKIYKQCFVEYVTNISFETYCRDYKSNMLIDYDFYCEGLKFDTCLNRKVSIKSNGDIKNCLYMSKEFGNYKISQLIDVVKLDDFQKNWISSKNTINACKKCEY